MALAFASVRQPSLPTWSEPVTHLRRGFPDNKMTN